jgi:glycerol-3-phosphate acyltransferase PlsY
MTLQNGLIEYLYPNGYKGIVLYGALFAVLFAAYLLGSINSAILFSKLVYKDDIRKHGSGNGGMTNMLRTFGGKAALLTLAGDLGKTVISIFIAGFVFGFRYYQGVSIMGYCYMAGLFAVLGHVFPIYYKFKGGKGVLVTSTMALILTPLPFLILFGVFAAIFAMSHFVSLGSVSVAMLYPVVLHGYFIAILNASMPAETALATIVLACLIVWCHRENLKRIGEGTEKKTFLKKSNKEKHNQAK